MNQNQATLELDPALQPTNTDGHLKPHPEKMVSDIPELATDEQLLKDYEQYGYILTNPTFQALEAKLDLGDISLDDLPTLQDLHYQLIEDGVDTGRSYSEVANNRFLKGAYVHCILKIAAKREEDFDKESKELLKHINKHSMGIFDVPQLRFNFRHNIEDARHLLHAIKHFDMKGSDKRYYVSLAKNALFDRGFTDEFQIRDKKQLRDDPNKLTNEMAAEAWYLGRIMADEETENVPEGTKNYLNTVNHTIARKVGDLQESLLNSGFVLDSQLLNQKQAKKINMVPLEKTLSKLVSRYIVQSAGDLDTFLADPSCVPIEELQSALDEALNGYLALYTHDIPLYDEVFENFDALRDNQDGKVPFEIYLGRDGIYAFTGRKAQQQAGKWEIDKAGKRVRKQSPFKQVISPKYLMFPRNYMTHLTDEAQEAYLKQESITRDQDPYIFDTGFKGTIPEHILTILGYDKEDIEKHIHLLTSDVNGRELPRVRDIASTRGYNLRSRVVDIEHSPKATKTSNGLYRDEKGKIRPINVANGPRDQLVFQTVKQGLWRHYWAKKLYSA